MNLEKRLTSWNSMINSFVLHGQSDSAIAIFEQMVKEEMGGCLEKGGVEVERGRVERGRENIFKNRKKGSVQVIKESENGNY